MRRAVPPALLTCLALAGCIPPGVRTDGSISQQPMLDDPAVVLATDEPPVWIARPVEAQARTSAGGTYTVVAGDTLSGIGERTGVGSELIIKQNGLAAPYALKAGQKLSIPSGAIHVVRAGDSGIAIARAYGVPWAQIVAANVLAEPFVLKVGQRLVVPTAPASAPQSAEARAAAFRIDIDDILTGGEPATAEGTASLPMPSAAVAVAEPGNFSGKFVWPAAGRIASRFGAGDSGEVNDGIDLAVAQAAPVVASSDGVVAFVGNTVGGYGGTILIRHGETWITAYGRVGRITVSRGQKVKRGQAIGTAGTGASPMLHFEIRKGKLPVDPLKQLPAR